MNKELSNQKPLVSVVLTTYKRPAEILVRSVRSVLEQTLKNLELIVINDSPDDPNESSIENALKTLDDSRVYYYVNEKNKGACFSRNRGASLASGEFIAFLDDDDRWKQDKLERHIPFFTDKDVGLVYAGMENHYNGRIKKIYPSVPDNEIFPDILMKNCIGGCSVPVLRKDAFDGVGGFDERFPASQDMDLWIRICQKYKVISINDCLTEYYYSDEAITRSLTRQLAGWDLIAEKYADIFNMYPQHLQFRRKREVSLCLEKGTFVDVKKYYGLYVETGGSFFSALPNIGKSIVKRLLSKLKLWKV